MFRLLLLVLVFEANAQNYGTGFGKTTYSVSDGLGCYNWLNTYFPIQQDYPSGARDCGKLGRARITTSSSNVSSLADAFPGNGFGMHCVEIDSPSARIHKTEGCPAIADLESKFDSKWSKVVAGGAYDPFLDYNGGYWVSSLDPYITKFTASKVPIVKLSWTDAANNKAYYSIIARVHTSMMLVELMSGECSSCSSALVVPTARFIFATGQSPQDLWGTLSDKTSQKPLLHPARLSWPSSDVTRERKFFAALEVDLVGKKQIEGVQTDVYDFSPLMPVAKTMQFHVVQRADDGSSFTWADYEASLMKCHTATIKDDLCGENPFMDNHVGFAQHGSSTKTLDAGIVKQSATALGLPFHATPSPMGTLAIYAMAGNGLSIAFQISQGSYTPPRTASGGMLDLCSEGTCSGPSPTPPGPSPPSPTPPTPPSPTPPSPPSPTPPSPPSPPASSCKEAIEKECGDYVGKPSQCMQCVNSSPKRPEMLAPCGLYRNMRTACGYPNSLVV